MKQFVWMAMLLGVATYVVGCGQSEPEQAPSTNTETELGTPAPDPRAMGQELPMDESTAATEEGAEVKPIPDTTESASEGGDAPAAKPIPDEPSASPEEGKKDAAPKDGDKPAAKEGDASSDEDPKADASQPSNE